MQEQSENHIMAIHIAQTEHAFRVNGVTIAKRHLAQTLAHNAEAEVDEKTLARYLVIVPFLATAFVMPAKTSESVKYGAVKAKRLYQALKLDNDNQMPFMMVFLAQAEAETSDGPQEALMNVAKQVRRAGFYGEDAPSFIAGETSIPAKRTLH